MSEEIFEEIFSRKCGKSCEFAKEIVYTSSPKCYRCQLTGTQHREGNDCTVLSELILRGIGK